METSQKTLTLAATVFLLLIVAGAAAFIFFQQNNVVNKIIERKSIPYEVKIPLNTHMIAEELYNESLKNGTVFEFNGDTLSSDEDSIVKFKEILGFKVYCIKTNNNSKYQIEECP